MNIKPLLKINIWNLLYSLINFLTNILIVRTLSVEIFGEFVVLNTYIAIGGLIFVLIPSSIAVFQYQDDKTFKDIYFSFFIVMSLIYLVYLIILSVLNIGGIIFIFYALMYVWYNYIDVTYQAQNQLKDYFKLLAYSAIGKVILILLFYSLKILNTIDELLLSMALPQLILLLLALKKDEAAVKWKNLVNFKGVCVYLKHNIRHYAPYYLNISLKRLQEQIPIIIFNSFVSKEILGIYSLFMKSISFIVGIVRTMEAYFNNRENIQSSFSKFFSNAFLLGIVTQTVFIVFTFIYIYIMLLDYYIIESIIASFFFLLYFRFLLVRVKYLSDYRIQQINISEIIFIISLIVLSFSFKYLINMEIKILLSIYILSSLISQIKLILSYKNHDISKKDNLNLNN
jgi:hypothetical protein